MQNYQKLEEIFNRRTLLKTVSGLLSWDMRVKMPKNSHSLREKQLQLMDDLFENNFNEHNLKNLLEKAHGENLNSLQQRNLELMQREHIMQEAIGPKLQKALTAAAVKCEHVWQHARTNNDFNAYAPLQQEVLDLTREIAQIKGEIKGLSPYDALIDDFEEGFTQAKITPIFDDIKAFLPNLIEGKIKSQEMRSKINLKLSEEKQHQLCLKILNEIGFDFSRARLDTTVHPFCSGSRSDVRIATKYDEDNFLSSIFALIHEAGHAFYDFGTDAEFEFQPIGSALGMTIHESQSLLFERQVALSEDFLSHLHKLISNEISEFDTSLENFLAHNLHIEKSLIRIEADELTYPLHIILRYEIEQELIGNYMQINDLPEMWNQKFKQHLGIKPTDYANGCMQDIHWTDGSFGYFPHYLLGAITAAQFFDSAQNDLGTKNLQAEFSRGKVSKIREFLTQNVHWQSSKMNAASLITHVTGKDLCATSFKNHLKNRYGT